MPRSRILAITILLAVLAAPLSAEIKVDSAIETDPDLTLPDQITVFLPEFKPLWLEALARPEADLQRQAAETIARAHRRGMPDLADTAEPLTRVLDAADQHPIVRLAAARALVALDARQAASVLLRHARDDLEVAQLVEPALARWNHRPVRDVWLRRLSQPKTRHAWLVLAVRGLGTVGEEKAAPRLLDMADDRSLAAAVRLEAAGAVAKIRSDGLEGAAGRLAADPSPLRLVDRLAAASLLAGHQGPAAEKLLLELAVDPEPAVAAIALERLLAIDPKLVLPVAGRCIANDDAKVRRLGAEAFVADETPAAVKALAPVLNDPHPDVRGYVRESLFQLASRPGLGEVVRDEAMRVLAGDRWRGLEQAALLLAALDHKPAADRLVELLYFDRPEVMATSAWALRKLAVPATLPAMFEKARLETEKSLQAAQSGTPEPTPEASLGIAEQLFQLHQAFGQMRYEPADPLLRKYIPKMSPFAIPCRAAAIWALGHIHAGRPDRDLTNLFVGRLSDTMSMMPEDDFVRGVSAVSLGRMKARDALPVLRKFYEAETDGSVGNACRWAVEHMTGESLPQPQPGLAVPGGWFLEPLDANPPRRPPPAPAEPRPAGE